MRGGCCSTRYVSLSGGECGVVGAGAPAAIACCGRGGRCGRAHRHASASRGCRKESMFFLARLLLIHAEI